MGGRDDVDDQPVAAAAGPVVSPNWWTRARYWSSPLGPVRTPGLRKARSMAQLEEKHIRRPSSVAGSSWANQGTCSGLAQLGGFGGDAGSGSEGAGDLVDLA